MVSPRRCCWARAELPLLPLHHSYFQHHQLHRGQNKTPNISPLPTVPPTGCTLCSRGSFHTHPCPLHSADQWQCPSHFTWATLDPASLRGSVCCHHSSPLTPRHTDVSEVISCSAPPHSIGIAAKKSAPGFAQQPQPAPAKPWIGELGMLPLPPLP